MKLWFLIFSWIILQSTASNADMMDVIGKFALEKFPSKSVIGLLCWKSEEINKLAKAMSKKGIIFNNFPVFSQPMKENLVLVDAKCDNFQRLIKQELKLVLYLNVEECSAIPQGNYKFRHLKLYILKENGKMTTLSSCMRQNNATSWTRKDVAHWDASKQAYKLLDRKPSIIVNLGSSIEVTFIASSATIRTIKDFRRHLFLEASSRFNHQLLQEVFAFLNLTPTVSFTSDPSSLDLISSISNELVGLPINVWSVNFTNYNFLSTRTPNRKAFLMRAPPLSAVSNVFTLPLEFNVWYACYILLVIIFVTIYVIVRVEWRFLNMVANKYRILYPKVMDVVQMQIGAIAQQGSEAEPTSGGGRIATFMIFLVFLFLYTAYSANIVALLGSTTRRVHGIRDLKEFNVKLGIDKKEFTRYEFQDQKSSEHLALYKAKLAKDDCYMSMDDGIGRVRNEFFAFHGDSDKIYKMIDRLYADNEKCGFVEIPYLSEPELLMPLRKDSMNTELLKVGLAMFLERGMHSRIKSIIFAKQPQCYNGGGNFVSVSLLDCYFAFVIYGGGTALALLIFLLEMLVARSKSHLRSKDQVINLHLQRWIKIDADCVDYIEE